MQASGLRVAFLGIGVSPTEAKKLLYEEGFTIAGARQQLKAENKPAKLQSGLPFPKHGRSDGLKKVRQGLQEILVLLKKKR